MRRRAFITLLGGAAASSVAWPLAVRAQQGAVPVIGFLHAGAPGPNAKRVVGFRKGLSEAGFVEGRNVAIEFHWADSQNDRLPEMAADLLRRQVAVIATLSSNVATLAAKAATTTIPIVFTYGSDPVEAGIVASLSRPGGNITGISTLNAELTAKRLGLMHELAPQSGSIAVLVNPTNPSVEQVSRDLQATATKLGLQIHIVHASNERELEAVFANLARKPGSALQVSTDPFFFIRRELFATLAARHEVPTIYYDREFTDSGGLLSYGTSVVGAWEQAGNYVGRILKGEKPADLPVAQAATFELVINLKAARALGLAIPNTLLSLADEVIE
jgi:putative ABC transport system substrate-binding protein